MNTFKNMAEMLKAHDVKAKDIINVTGKTKSFACLILSGKNNLPVKYHNVVSMELNIEPVELQVAYIADCIDNYERSLKCTN